MPFTFMKGVVGDTSNGGHNTRLAVLLGIIAVLSFKVMAVPPTADAVISEAAYFSGADNGGNNSAGSQFQWLCDTGCNRFVTNNRSDFIPTSITKSTTVVAIGSGSVTCEIQGTVLIRNPQGKTIACSSALYIIA
jgi:hypothetical protein